MYKLGYQTLYCMIVSDGTFNGLRQAKLTAWNCKQGNFFLNTHLFACCIIRIVIKVKHNLHSYHSTISKVLREACSKGTVSVNIVVVSICGISKVKN